MRLTPHQIQMIDAAVNAFAGNEATTWLYGSRLDDAKHGGDVDLLVQSNPQMGLLQRARLKTRLESELGLPVDVMSAPKTGLLSPFVRIALAQGVRI